MAHTLITVASFRDAMLTTSTVLKFPADAVA